MRLTRIAARVKRSPRPGLMSGQKGQMLVEVLIAVAILGVAGVAFLSALVVSYGAATLNDQKTTAESLSRAELERIRNAGYDTVVDNTTATLGYDVIVDAEYIDPATYLPTGSPLGMKKVTVTVNRQGKVLLVTETIKVAR